MQGRHLRTTCFKSGSTVQMWERNERIFFRPTCDITCDIMVVGIQHQITSISRIWSLNMLRYMDKFAWLMCCIKVVRDKSFYYR